MTSNDSNQSEGIKSKNGSDTSCDAPEKRSVVICFLDYLFFTESALYVSLSRLLWSFFIRTCPIYQIRILL